MKNYKLEWLTIKYIFIRYHNIRNVRNPRIDDMSRAQYKYQYVLEIL